MVSTLICRCIDLNKIPTEFYLRFGTISPAQEWLKNHEYHEAFDAGKED